MVMHHNQCFVVADGGHARFVKPASDNALHTVVAGDSATVHKRSHDLGSDRPGRSFESASPSHHSESARTDLHDAEKLKFAKLVAARICEESTLGEFNELILVAPTHILQELQDGLDKPTAAKLIGTLAKDLTKVPDHELWPHLKQWVRPTHRL